ncbi:LCP family protein [Demequina sp. NBRC 110053]|uniref:LCP family protein n=1 Tax=Demequina sp. NBRC 110053 TaxID=1570342 RepID=UPI0013562E71|nr:LCP family protein [Demequina sp. NBRC 110053]
MAVPVERVRHGDRLGPHPAVRALAIAVAAAVGFGIVFAQTVTSSFSGSLRTEDVDPLITSTPDAPEPTQEGAGEPVNILLIGSDVRSGDNAAIGGATGGGMRADVTIIAHVSGDSSRVDMVSIPRDLQVEVPDCTRFDGSAVPGGYGDFNVALANGGRGGNVAEGAACVINTIHDVFDVRIDHYAVVDFSGFVRMVDSLGGIPMCVPERIVSEDAELNLRAGPQVFDGLTALNWARLRTAEVGDVSGSDLQRIARQQDLLASTFRTAVSKNLFSDADQLAQFVRAGAESLTTDEKLGSLTAMASLAFRLRGLGPDDISYATVPWEYTDGRNNVVMTDDADILFDDLRHDRSLSVAAQGDATSEWGDDAGDEPASEPSAASTVAPRSPQPESTATRTETVQDILAECDAHAREP